MGEQFPRPSMQEIGKSSPVPEFKDAPCNICGRGWPYHAEACAYLANVRDLYEVRAECARLRAVLEKIANPFYTLENGVTYTLSREACTDIARAALGEADNDFGETE